MNEYNYQTILRLQNVQGFEWSLRNVHGFECSLKKFTVIWKAKLSLLKSPPQAPLGSGFCTDPPLENIKNFGKGGDL